MRAIDAPSSTSELSARELQIVRLLVEGLSNQQIAAQLGISPRTVQTHLAAAGRKAGTATRTQLAVAALQRGWAPWSVDG